MSELKKFLFDTNDFSDDAIIAAANSYSEEQFLLAKEQSFEQGKNEGIQQTRQQQEEKIASLLQKSLTSIDALIALENRREVEKYIQALEISIAVIRKTFPTLAENNTLNEIERSIKENLDIKRDEPLINIYIPSVHLQELSKRIKDAIAQNNYSAQINILEDSTLNTTDCRIEWADGGIEKSLNMLLENIEKEFNIANAGLNLDADKADKQPPSDILAKKAEIDTETDTEAQEKLDENN